MKCSKCGNEFEGKFCPECGTPANAVSDSSADQNTPQQIQNQQPLYQNPAVPTPKKKKKGCITAVIIVAVIVVLIIILIQSCGNRDTPTLVTSSSSGTATVSSEIAKTTFKVGETAKYNDVEMTVTKVAKVKSGDYSVPKEGNEYVVVSVKYKNDSSENVSYNPYDFKMKNSKGQITSNTYASDITKNQLDSGDLAPNGEVEGEIIYEEPKDDNGLVLQYTGNIFDSNSQVDFQLQ